MVDTGNLADRVREVRLQAWYRHQSLIIDVVRECCGADSAWHKVHVQDVPGSPGDVMVGARGVTADANRADEYVGSVVQGQTTPKHIHPSNLAANEGIVRRPEV